VYRKVLSIILVSGILGAIAALAYTLAKPTPGENFTEFYILGSEGKTQAYPEELLLGQEGRVTLGIVNREAGPMSYRVEWTIENTVAGEIQPIELQRGQEWEKEITFTPQLPGENQKLAFKLYKIHQLGNQSDKDTLLALRLGKDELSAIVVNQGATEASYRLRLSIREFQGNQTQIDSSLPISLVKWIGPLALAPGEVWKPALSYDLEEGSWREIDFSFYRDDQLLYEEKTSASYPALYLLIDVIESRGVS
jgi:hypothetical protein